MINPLIFREYDIRGTVDRDLNPETVNLLGKGIGTLLRRAGKSRMVVGRDNRLSSPSYRDALTAGLLSTGVDVIDECTSSTIVHEFRQNVSSKYRALR